MATDREENSKTCVTVVPVMLGSHCRSDQSIKPDQAIGDWSGSLGRSGWGGVPCSALVRLPTR